MGKKIVYGAPKTRAEKRDAFFRQQIEALKISMGAKSLAEINEMLGFGDNKLYRLYRNPGKLTLDDADRIDKLFGRYGMRLGIDPLARGGEAYVCG